MSAAWSGWSAGGPGQPTATELWVAPWRMTMTLAQLVLHHAALAGERRLVERGGRVRHAVGLEPDRSRQRARGDPRVVVDRVARGLRVRLAPDVLEPLRVVTRRGVARAVEHEVFVEVREAGQALRVILRADVVAEVDERLLRVAPLRAASRS